jgi:hypothetical protein
VKSASHGSLLLECEWIEVYVVYAICKAKAIVARPHSKNSTRAASMNMPCTVLHELVMYNVALAPFINETTSLPYVTFNLKQGTRNNTNTNTTAGLIVSI